MGLRTERGGDELPDRLLKAAEDLVAHLDPARQSELYWLSSNARQGIVSSQEWRSFEVLLRNARIDPRDRNHATAVMLVLLPTVLKREKSARFAATKEAHERIKRAGNRGTSGRPVEFAVSTESSTSINKGAERFPLALNRLAKK